MKTLTAILLLAFSTSAIAQEPPATDTRKCTVEGRVLKEGSQEPIRKARLVLSGGMSPVMRAMTRAETGKTKAKSMRELSGTDGKFKFENVEPGTYVLVASRTGFVPARYSDPKGGRAGQFFTLNPGDHLSDITISMTPAGIISGRVYDSDGEPAPRVRVELLSRASLGGREEQLPVEADDTNDFGEFRLFDLPPGKYILRAIPSGGDFIAMTRAMSRMMEQGADKEESAPSYYPNTPDPKRAEPLEVKAGQEMRIDLTLFTTRTFTVRGRVTPAPAEGARGGAVVYAMPADAGLLSFREMKNGIVMPGKATFEIVGLAPGSYNISAMMMGEDGESRNMGRVRVEISSHDVDDILISMTSGSELNGKIRFDTAPPQNVTSLHVSLEQSGEMAFFGGPADGKVKEDGSFKLGRVYDGDYFVEVSNLPEGYYVRSAKVGREDCTDEPLHVTGGISGTLDINVAKGMATLSGTVRDAEGNPASRAMVMLVNEKAMKRMRFGRSNASTEENGSFRFKDLPPGNYVVVAVDALEMESGGATAFLNLDSILKSQGKQVRLDITSNETIELKLAKLRE